MSPLQDTASHPFSTSRSFPHSPFPLHSQHPHEGEKDGRGERGGPISCKRTPIMGAPCNMSPFLLSPPLTRPSSSTPPYLTNALYFTPPPRIRTTSQASIPLCPLLSNHLAVGATSWPSWPTSVKEPSYSCDSAPKSAMSVAAECRPFFWCTVTKSISNEEDTRWRTRNNSCNRYYNIYQHRDDYKAR